MAEASTDSDGVAKGLRSRTTLFVYDPESNVLKNSQQFRACSSALLAVQTRARQAPFLA